MLDPEFEDVYATGRWELWVLVSLNVGFRALEEFYGWAASQGNGA